MRKNEVKVQQLLEDYRAARAAEARALMALLSALAGRPGPAMETTPEKALRLAGKAYREGIKPAAGWVARKVRSLAARTGRAKDDELLWEGRRGALPLSLWLTPSGEHRLVVNGKAFKRGDGVGTDELMAAVLGELDEAAKAGREPKKWL